MYHDYNAYRRGGAYFREGRVTIEQFDGHAAACRVHGHHGIYHVAISAGQRGSISMGCDCPAAERSPICKHIIASMYALQDYLQGAGGEQWRYRMLQALERTKPARSGPAQRARYAILFGLKRSGGLYENATWSLIPYRLNLKDWVYGGDLTELTEREQQNQLLDQHRSWTYSASAHFRFLDERLVSNADRLGVHLFNVVGKESQFYYSSNIDAYLPSLRALHLPVFRLEDNNSTFGDQLVFLDSPGRIEAVLSQEGQDFTIHAGMQIDGERFSTIKRNFEVISSGSSAWVLAGKNLLEVENASALELLDYFPMHIPKEELQEFRDEFLPKLAERIPISGSAFTWTEVNADPTPRLYLRDQRGILTAEMRFGYGEHEVNFTRGGDLLTVRAVPGSWGMVRLYRQPEKELEFYQLLTDARYGLKRATSLSDGMFQLRARTHPFDFLTRSISLLIEAGFEIYGEENLQAGRINRSHPTISLNITSGIDWFDLNATVSYGDQQVSLRDIRRALRRKEKYVKLADGSIGPIPQEWIERYKQLFDLAEETPQGLRVRDFHLTLVDELLQDASETQVAAEFRQRRERLRGFEQIQPQPLPSGFTGELRPYQKAGLDWMHFLHEYGFGGCLADDMGLGKTVEVLAFLQSLREQGRSQGPSLLVVPKSLLANWQREVERFTPELKIMEHVGVARSKNTASFEGCDLVLTTYGTMLRDAHSLRAFQFDYIILDESQAIKNPVAQTAKAARLLQARHRLVMTGTPVENNTFELWSQFAFLNPGLLGSVDYFKKEFAAPLEKEGEAAGALQSLRRLVYPFILRRTKEQVAPDLPPRTERVLYVDLEPAQRKLYEQTKTYYRKVLMGVIDQGGLDQARMKILEGLLRLRQICIHPRLVEDTFKGSAAKFETLLDMLESLQSEGHKALIFSQFVQTLHLLEQELKARKVRYTYLDGSTNNRQEQVDRFQQESDIPFFLISLKAGGVGLNLTAADYVINIDPWWNPAVEMQAADRAHRIGQDKPVFVYKLIVRDSVEEKILQLQEKKKELVEQVISTESSFFKSLTRADVGALFS